MDLQQTLNFIMNFWPLVTLYGPDLVGILLPPVIDVLSKDIKPEQEGKRFIATLTVCFIAAILLKGPSLMVGTPQGVIVSFGILFTECQIVYKAYFKNSNLRASLQNKLSPTPSVLVDGPVG